MTGPRKPSHRGRARGPAGLTAAVFASGILQAAALAFDSQDRLWVATAAYTDTGQDGVYLVTTGGLRRSR
jgi:hypothetical protein